jgi:hypothetical protein
MIEGGRRVWMMVVIAMEVCRRVSRPYGLHGLFACLDQVWLWDILVVYLVVAVSVVVKN